MSLPDLGVGLIYLPGLEPLLAAGQHLLDVIEVEPQTFWFQRGTGYRQRDDVLSIVEGMPHHKLVHGVGFPIGGTRRPGPAAVRPFAETVRRLSAPWCSEHLSFNRVRDGAGEFGTLFLLPPVQTAESASLAASNIRAVRRLLPVPFAFETGVNYLRPLPGELTDGAFFAAVAEQADCGILLDLHNLWCNERNGRQPVLDALAEMPLDRVWEVHLAGGQELDRYWLDAHSGLVPEPLLDLAARVIPALPNLHAVIFEMIPDYLAAGRVSVPEVVAQLERIRDIWDHRRSTANQGTPTPAPAGPPAPGHPTSHPVGRPPGAEPDGPLPDPATWESTLGRTALGHPLVHPLGHPGSAALGAALAADPGIGILRQVTGQVRAGMVADTLRFTFRLILLSRGEERFRELLAAFWQRTPPEMFAAAEAAAFATHLTEHAADIPYLTDIVAFELATHRAQVESQQQRVLMGCEPLALLTALGEGRLPGELPTGRYEVVIPAS